MEFVCGFVAHERPDKLQGELSRGARTAACDQVAVNNHAVLAEIGFAEVSLKTRITGRLLPA